MEPNSVLAKQLQNLDLNSDSSLTSQELAHFNREKMSWACIRERPSQEQEKFNFISFNQLIGLQESDEDRHQDEEDKHDQQDPKIKQKDQLFSTLNQMGMSISKMAQLDTLGFQKALSKGKEDN